MVIRNLKFVEDDYYIIRQIWSGIDYGVAVYQKCGDHENLLSAKTAKDQEDADHLLAIFMDGMEMYHAG
jgi:hypothetical protein